eukprot:TRINITY_DN7615_c0_g1_i1.p1 TRINITY_DN7615_c0_g1~~TRINITY_DN7615_c0_g1_i1.p1  ORF type:complete len:589 (+),score=152.54 TRINITY_DN7615_c0_g1_i1:64-1830(+)
MERGLSFTQTDKFWSDLPDDILLELQADLENAPAMSNNGLDFLAEMTFGTSGLSASQEIREFIPDLRMSDGLAHLSKVVSTKMDDVIIKESNVPIPATPIASIDINMIADTNGKEEVKMEAIGSQTDKNRLSIKAQAVLKDAKQNVELHDLRLKEHYKRQGSVTSGTKKEELLAIQDQLFKLHTSITTSLGQMDEVWRSEILDCVQVFLTTDCIQALQVQQQKADILRQELQHIIDNDKKSVAALAIISQAPFQIVFKSRVFEAPFVVELLTGATLQLVRVSPIKASLANEVEGNYHATKPLLNEVKPLDKGCAKFGDMKVNISTKMNYTSLKFSCTIRHAMSRDEIPVRSSLSNPLIVITNESQWGEAAGKLLQDALSGQPDVGWQHFVNVLLHHVLRSTSQGRSDPTMRGFSDWELEHLHRRFFGGRDRLTRDEVKAFWSWFGSVLTTLRFKRHIKVLWLKGLIYGMIAKSDCHKILKDEDSGTFLLRFSDSNPGSFAVAYCTDDPSQKIKHYLVKPEDIGTNKSLPDFLKEKGMFKTIVVYNVQNGTSQKQLKTSALDHFYSNSKKTGKQQIPEASGYVQQLEET